MWKFSPILKTTLWGGDRIIPFKGLDSRLKHVGESWELSSVPGSESVVDDGPDRGLTLTELIDKYTDSLMGKRNYTRFGNRFPILVKIIDARQDLSVQVHPDDSLAQARGHLNGKSEMWYVISRQPALIATGFTREVDPSELDTLLEDGSIESVLKRTEVHKGDVFHIPAGRVHALGAGAMVIEIQQTSDLTYRLYDYHRLDRDGKERELHVDLAREAILYNDTEACAEDFRLRMEVPTTVLKTPRFTANLLVTDSQFIRDYSESDTFVVLVCAEGECDVTCGKTQVRLMQGSTVLVPANANGIEIDARKRTVLLETFPT